MYSRLQAAVAIAEAMREADTLDHSVRLMGEVMLRNDAALALHRMGGVKPISSRCVMKASALKPKIRVLENLPSLGPRP